MPARYIRDSIHSFVSFERKGLINQIIDTEEFQRMRDIRQLGFSYMTYPNAVHTRFSHSLGTYWLATRFGDLYIEDKDNRQYLQIAALLHDIGHGPFSHALDKLFMPEKSHEQLSCDLIESQNHSIAPILIKNGIDPKRVSEIIIGAIQPKYLHKIISSQLDVDRFDFLKRDSLSSGNPHGNFDLERIIQTLRINDQHEIYVDEGGWDAVEHYLNCRYQMYKQVYNHRATISANEMVKKIILRARELYQQGLFSCEERYFHFMESRLDLNDFMELTDTDILNIIKTCKRCGDPILTDLQMRFASRKLFKSITVPMRCVPKIEENHEQILRIISEKYPEPENYFSTVRVGQITAYQPYPIKPKDPEDFIYIDKKCKRHISTEIKSLKAIASKIEYYVFIPDDECKNKVKKILSV